MRYQTLLEAANFETSDRTHTLDTVALSNMGVDGSEYQTGKVYMLISASHPSVVKCRRFGQAYRSVVARENIVEPNSISYLYVEDDLFCREVMQLIMESEVQPLYFEMFEDSSDFMNRLSKLPSIPDIILLDIHMKPCSGFDLLKMIRADKTYDHCRIVALTARVMVEEIELLKSKGFDAAIAKPIPFELMPQLFDQIQKGESVWHI